MAFNVQCYGFVMFILCVCESKIHLVDMSYTFNNKTVYWPTATLDKFRFTKKEASNASGVYYEVNQFCAPEHGGTHLDAPRHFAKGKHSVDEIPLERLIGPVTVIDVSEKAAKTRDLLIGKTDFEEHEKQNGRIPDDVILLLYTGWGKRWPMRKEYLGTDSADVSLMHFPGLAESGARWILTHMPKIKSIGIDTASIDSGQSKNAISHQLLMAQNIPVFENVANIDKIPTKGVTIYALPMKIGEGSGAPLRIIATWDDNSN